MVEKVKLMKFLLWEKTEVTIKYKQKGAHCNNPIISNT